MKTIYKNSLSAGRRNKSSVVKLQHTKQHGAWNSADLGLTRCGTLAKEPDLLKAQTYLSFYLNRPRESYINISNSNGNCILVDHQPASFGVHN